MTLEVQGTKKFDFWEWKGDINLSIIPKGAIKGVERDFPIRLQVGNPAWGQRHIDRKHGHLLKGLTAQDFVHKKLGEPGTIYSTEEHSKFKILMRYSPTSLLVLRETNHQKLGDFLTVVTIYPQNRHVDGEIIGRYKSYFRSDIP